MSKTTPQETPSMDLAAVRERCLYAQRVCSWCDDRCEDANELIDHILAQHKQEVRH